MAKAKRKKVAKRRSSMKRYVAPARKADPSERFVTIGARFLDGPNPFKVYTYQIRRGFSVFLGQELVADTPTGPRLAICVRLDATFNPEAYPGELKTITRKVVML